MRDRLPDCHVRMVAGFNAYGRGCGLKVNGNSAW